MADWIEINATSLRYDLRGAGPRTMVLLHEMGGTLETWDDVVGAFPDWRILRFDMRGAGLSEKVRSMCFDDLVDDVRALLDALAIHGQVCVAGIAVGAAVAVGFAARHPARVARLVLMAPATGIAPENRAATQALADGIRSGGLRARVLSRLPSTFPEQFRDDPARFEAFRGRALANDPESYAACYDMLMSLDLSADFAALQCPTLVLAGTADATRPPARVAGDAAKIRTATFEAVASGHVMPALTPGLIADAFRRFFAAA